MIITLDGKPATGKSTQAYNLSNLFNIEGVKVWDTARVFRHIAQLPRDAKGYYRLNGDLFSILEAYHTIPESCIVEGLWLPVATSIRHPHLDFDSIIEWFRTSLRFHSEPILSIYLDLPEDERVKRLTKRETKNIGQIEVGQIELIGNPKEDRHLPGYRYIAERVPYFHIIDANQPEEVITESILSLLPKTK